MTNLNLKHLPKLLVVLLLALALKYHYSTASVDELKWVLAPTTVLVELITGINFAFEAHAGYMSADNRFLIAASCSGVNFMIVAFLLITLLPLWRDEKFAWLSILSALPFAYGATLAANTVRIVAALGMQRLDLASDALHRVEGIVVYFGSLLALVCLVERKRNGFDGKSVAYLLGFYYAITLGIPLVRGSFLEPHFWNHAFVVVVLPLAMILFLVLFATRVPPQAGVMVRHRSLRPPLT